MSDKKRLTKSLFIAAIAEKSELSKKQVSSVLEAMNALVTRELSKKGPGEVVVPGLLKLNLVIKPATKARKGINPFTKEPTVFKAKPARKVIKARALKAFKDAI